MKIDTSFVPSFHPYSLHVFSLLQSGNLDPRDAAAEIIALMRADARSPASQEGYESSVIIGDPR